VIHWKETAEILSRLVELAAAGRRAALATVVRIAGSAYRRPGAKFLVEEGGGTLGGVSGGCLEADVREVAAGVLAGGEPRLLRYDTGADSGRDEIWGLGLGCDGRVEVFLQPATEGPLAALTPALRELLAGEEAVVVATAVDCAGPAGAGSPSLVTAGAGPGSPGIRGSLGSPELDRVAVERSRALAAAGRSSLEELGDRLVFFDVLSPPPHLLVCGAGDDARPLVAYAADAGFRVTVLDHRPALAVPGRFPDARSVLTARPEEPAEQGPALPPAAHSMAVVMTHSLRHDREWVRRLLAAGVPYVGVLGPRARTEAMLAELGAGHDPRVFGPVGLDLGADGPNQVAMSVVAELLAVTSGREPRHLAARREAIHAD
jgi:xanthine/CO dehydrogenase XdhC/CoxF family maturation factor